MRCGSCHEVFDGNAAMIEPMAATPPVILPIAPQVSAPAPVLLAIAEPLAAPIDLTIDAAMQALEVKIVSTLPATVDATPNVDAFGMPLEKAPPEPASSTEPEPEPEPKPELAPAPAFEPAPARTIDFDIGPLPVSEPESEPEPQAPAAPESEPEPAEHPPAEPAYAYDGRLEPSLEATDGEAARQFSAADEIPDAELESDSEAETVELDEPGFVKQGRRRQRIGKALRILMGVGSLALLGALLGQGVMTFRNQLAAQLPQLKPALTSACAMLGCRIELPAQIDAISVEGSELQTLSEAAFSYATVLHNQSSIAQAWPNIELTLDDGADKTLLRRVILPREYLPPTVDLSKGFPPHSEQAVRIYFELAQLKASGYHIAIFYP